MMGLKLNFSRESKLSSTKLFEKYFGKNTAAVDLKHPNIVKFFDAIEKECKEEDKKRRVK